MEYMSEIIVGLIGLLAGATIGIAVTVKVKNTVKSDRSYTTTTQKNIRTKGDVAGRDVNKT